jgi:hypothetical protein
LEIAKRPDILAVVSKIMGPDGDPLESGRAALADQTQGNHQRLDRARSVYAGKRLLEVYPRHHGGEIRHIDINDTAEGKDAAVRLILDTSLVHGSNPN